MVRVDPGMVDGMERPVFGWKGTEGWNAVASDPSSPVDGKQRTQRDEDSAVGRMREDGNDFGPGTAAEEEGREERGERRTDSFRD